MLKKFKKKNLKSEKGITLIALVITIIVLLILAGISISMLSGNNSILSRATDAKKKTEYGKAQEALSIAYAEAVGDRYLNNSTVSLESEVVQKLQNAGYTIATEASGTMQLELSSTSVTLEAGGNTEEVTATIKTNTKYMLVDGLYYQLTITDSTATLGEEGKSGLTDSSSVSLSDLTLNTTGSITAELNASTGVITITSLSQTLAADENNDIVELVHKDNGTKYGTINVAVKKASITISPTMASVEEGKKTTLSAQLNSWQKGTISWSVTAGGTYATIPESSTANSVEVTGVTKGIATITATYTTGNTSVTITRDVEVFSVIGDYVSYNLPYTDMYSDTDQNTDGLQGYNFTATDGWRLLSRTENSSSLGKYDIKIISTGIPAKLYYHYDSNIGNGNNGWWGTDSQVEELYGSTYSTAGYKYSIYNNSGYPNYYAATGLQKNFSSITFDNETNQSTANKGCWQSVAGKTSGTGADFIASGFATGTISVHNLTLEELNTARNLETTSVASTKLKDGDTGLFCLRNLVNENSRFGYTSTGVSQYWLCNPKDVSNSEMYYVNDTGGFNGKGSYDIIFGLRPVIEIQGVTMIQDSTTKVWTISQ